MIANIRVMQVVCVCVRVRACMHCICLEYVCIRMHTCKCVVVYPDPNHVVKIRWATNAMHTLRATHTNAEQAEKP